MQTNDKDKEILKDIEEDTFVPPCVPYQRTIEHDDGIIEIIMYD